MKYWTECECCGHKIVAHVHRLNKGLVDAFCTFRFFYWSNVGNPNVLPLTHNQKANWQKLQYWWIVERVKGGWVVTDKGHDWRFDRISINDIVATMWKKILPYNHEAWHTTKVMPKWIALSSVLTLEEYKQYKRREDYQEEMPSKTNGYRPTQMFIDDPM